VPIIIAQALAEKGALDGVASGISRVFDGGFASVSNLLHERPYLLIVIGVVLFLLLKKRR
jgi:hypothetical protein